MVVNRSTGFVTPVANAESHHPDTQPEVRAFSKMDTRATGRRVVNRAQMFATQDAQACVDKTQLDLAGSLLRQQYLVRPVVDGVERAAAVNMVLVSGTRALLPYHFYLYCKNFNIPSVSLTNAFISGKLIAVEDLFADCVVVEHADMILVNLFRLVPPGRDLVKHFVTAADAAKYRDIKVDDFEKRLIALPIELDKMFSHNEEAREFFTSLSIVNQKEYLSWIQGAKKEETKQKRLEATMEKLMAGKNNPSEK